MNRYFSTLLYTLAILFLTSCASLTVNNAVKHGAIVLKTQQIFDLSSENTLRLVSADFDSYLYFGADGELSARSIFNNNSDHGSWDIANDDKICIRFNVWYFGDVKCYSVYKEAESDNYLLFTENGALAYTATLTSGNSQGIKGKNQKEGKKVFVRSSMNKSSTTGKTSPEPAAVTPAPIATNSGSSASQEEVKHTVKSMAQDCPDCNFEDADLRKAHLVGANLKGANLKGADLSRANLRRANLEGADLSGATLLSTNLPGANLKDADLSGVDFTGSNLIRADFSGANMKGCILDNTLQEGTKGIK